MKRRFRVTVDGQVFEVEVEDLQASAGAVEPSRAAVVEPPPQRTADAASAPAAVSRRAAPASGGTIKAPLPGMVLDVKVAQGSAVAEGQVLVILEAMKMENEIVASSAGVVKKVHVAKGDSVAAGDVLLVLQ